MIERFWARLAVLALSAILFSGTTAATGPFEGNPLVGIPAGEFVFGADDGEGNEAPRRIDTMAAFRINRFEVTNRLYRVFVEASGHRPSFFDGHRVFGRPDHPVVGVSWHDADAFCRHYGLKLPSERQWERAARGVSGHPFAWGAAPPTPDRVNRGGPICCGPDSRDGYPATAPVGSFPSGTTEEGLFDMTGNVWEWVDGWYNAHDAAPAAQERKFRVLRGGAWNSGEWKLRTTYRMAYRGDFRFAANGGFRCVSD
jgi:iron(II)-dependent oxidoreductase